MEFCVKLCKPSTSKLDEWNSAVNSLMRKQMRQDGYANAEIALFEQEAARRFNATKGNQK